MSRSTQSKLYIASYTYIVQEAIIINLHDYISTSLINNFLMPHDSSLQFNMCIDWDLIGLEILWTHTFTVLKKFNEYVKITIMFLSFLKYLISE